MYNEISTLSSMMQKVMDLGSIDKWLRGVTLIVPQTADLEDMVSTNFNRHTFSYSEEQNITPTDIKKMVGFRQLMSACSKNNIAVDLRRFRKGTLELQFMPQESFCKSRVFGKSYTSALPEIFFMDANDTCRMN